MSTDTAPNISKTDIIRPAKLAHVVIKTTRYSELIDWYRFVLGAEIAHQNPMVTFLYYDDEHHRLAVINGKGLLPNLRGAAGVDHFAFTYATLGDLLSTYERLKQHGIEPVWPINHGGTTSLYYRDPDSNVIELQVDNFPTRAETNEFLQDGRFAINPVGIDIDPDEWLERHRAGVPDEDLTRWPEIMKPRTTPPPTAYLGRIGGAMLALAGRLKRRR
ncbi:VOC family protein [Candidatus Poriferisodalis sp.]|uniref:VOC family protein n=1 Tax=Candidatus Poriferisodalis sp. TaxID=3101277 RepID=UPI003B015486